MEKLTTNIDFQKDRFRTICWVLSLISWVFFLLLGWISFLLFLVYKQSNIIIYHNIWSFIDVDGFKEYNRIPYYPIQANRIFYIILFLLLLLLASASFGLYLFKGCFRKDDNFYEAMMDKFTRYHFVRIICAITLFLVGNAKKLFVKPEITNGTLSDFLNNLDSSHAGFSTCLAFSLIGLFSMVFIKYQTKLEQQPFYILYTIKEGLYSVLIALFVYNIFYSSVYIGVDNKYKSVYKNVKTDPEGVVDKLEKLLVSLPGFMNDCGIAFSIMIGIINIALGIFLKDLLILVVNFIIYVGLAKYFFSIDKLDKNINNINNAEGALDIIILILNGASLALTVFIKFFSKNKKESQNEMNESLN